jgi:hypothetical protein
MSTPPSQPPGPYGHQHWPPQQPTPPRKRAWLRRHPIWSIVITLFTLFVLLVILAAIIAPASPPSAKASYTAPAPAPTSTTPAAVATLLTCKVQASSKYPRDHTTVKIRVSTIALARVTATGPLAPASGESAAGHASAEGTWTVDFQVGNSRPGTRVVLTVRVSRHGSNGSCHTSLRPLRVKPAPPAAPPSAAPAPLSSAPAPPPPPPAPSPPATAASCYPLSNEGTCYEPGEFCRESDHGMTGMAGDGEKIICTDNNGWRWEPA